MNNFFTLVKYNIIMSFNNLKGKNGRRSNLTAILFLLLIIGIVVYAYSYQTISSFDLFIEYNHSEFPIFNSVSNALLIACCLSLLRMSLITKTNDSDFLLSLPINKCTIVASKMLTNLLYDLSFIFLIFMPCIIVYFVKIQFSILILFTSILFVILLSIIANCITIFLNFISNALFSKFKMGKILTSIFYLLVFCFVMIFIFTNTSYIDYLLNNDLQSYYNNRPITKFLFSFIISPTYLNSLTFIFVTVLLFIAAWFLFSFSFGKNYTYIKSSNNKLIFNYNSSPIILLYKKELLNYFNTPMYLINTIIGPIMILLIPFLGDLFGLNSLKNSLDMMAGTLAVIISLLLALTTISASSISLEGKNIWILKSTPISEKTIFFSKISTHLTITTIPLIFSTIILTFLYSFNFFQFMLLFSLPFVFNIFFAVFGLFINLCLPMLNFDNEIKPVKQSMSVFVTLMSGMLICFIPFILLQFTNLAPLIIYLISFSISVLGLIISIILLLTKGVILFKKLNY